MTVLERIIRNRAGGFALAFHEISAERMVDLVESLGPFEAVPLDTLVERSKAGKSTAGLFAITVDDCVGANTRSLVPALKEKSWPATFYAPTLYLDSKEEMPFQWWFKAAPFLENRILELRSQRLDFTQPGAVNEYFRKLETLWHTEPRETYVSTIAEIVEVLTRDHGIARTMLTPEAPISWAELAEMSRDDLIRFESHGVSHTAMSALAETELEFEMEQSKRSIMEHTGRECRHLAYPFGSSRSIGTLAPTVAARYYDSAVTMTLGSVDRADPWLLPRIPLYPENSNTVARAKILLKCCSPLRRAAG